MEETAVAVKEIVVDDQLLAIFPDSLPQDMAVSLRLEALALAERLQSFLPEGGIEEIAIFKKRANPDPVIAIKVLGKWYSLYEWE